MRGNRHRNGASLEIVLLQPRNAIPFCNVFPRSLRPAHCFTVFLLRNFAHTSVSRENICIPPTHWAGIRRAEQNSCSAQYKNVTTTLTPPSGLIMYFVIICTISVDFALDKEKNRKTVERKQLNNAKRHMEWCERRDRNIDHHHSSFRNILFSI